MARVVVRNIAGDSCTRYTRQPRVTLADTASGAKAKAKSLMVSTSWVSTGISRWLR